MRPNPVPLPYFSRQPSTREADRAALASNPAASQLWERAMLFSLALLLLIGMFMIAVVPQQTRKPSLLEVLVVAMTLAAAFLVVHTWVRRYMPNADRVLLIAIFSLISLGIIVIWRLEPSLMLLYPDLADQYENLGIKQTIYAVVGLGLMVLVGHVLKNLSHLKQLRSVAAVLGIVLVATTPFFGVGTEEGIKLWYRIGPVTFQPSELLKVLLVIWVAGYMEDRLYLLNSPVVFRGFRLPPLPYLLPLALTWGLTIFLFVVEKDLGSALLFFGIFLIMLYVATGSGRYVLSGLSLLVLGYTGLKIFIPSAVLVFERRYALWLNPWAQESGRSDQIIQGLFALSNGGVLGTGLGYGQPYRVSAAHTDMIITAIGEELGFAGVVMVLCLLAILIYRGLRIALGAEWGFEQLLALGLTATLGLQAIIILAGSMKLVPLTGITLPFVSYGGTSLVINCMIIGLLLRISQNSAQAKRVASP